MVVVVVVALWRWWICYYPTDSTWMAVLGLAPFILSFALGQSNTCMVSVVGGGGGAGGGGW